MAELDSGTDTVVVTMPLFSLTETVYPTRPWDKDAPNASASDVDENAPVACIRVTSVETRHICDWRANAMVESASRLMNRMMTGNHRVVSRIWWKFDGGVISG